MSGVMPFGRLEICQVLMICPDNEWQNLALEPVSPLLQCGLDAEVFVVSHIIVLFCRGETTKEIGTGMELTILLLGEHGPQPQIAGFRLHDELET